MSYCDIVPTDPDCVCRPADTNKTRIEDRYICCGTVDGIRRNPNFKNEEVCRQAGWEPTQSQLNLRNYFRTLSRDYGPPEFTRDQNDNVTDIKCVGNRPVIMNVNSHEVALCYNDAMSRAMVDRTLFCARLTFLYHPNTVECERETVDGVISQTCPINSFTHEFTDNPGNMPDCLTGEQYEDETEDTKTTGTAPADEPENGNGNGNGSNTWKWILGIVLVVIVLFIFIFIFYSTSKKKEKKK